MEKVKLLSSFNGKIGRTATVEYGKLSGAFNNEVANALNKFELNCCAIRMVEADSKGLKSLTQETFVPKGFSSKLASSELLNAIQERQKIEDKSFFKTENISLLAIEEVIQRKLSGSDNRFPATDFDVAILRSIQAQFPQSDIDNRKSYLDEKNFELLCDYTEQILDGITRLLDDGNEMDKEKHCPTVHTYFDYCLNLPNENTCRQRLSTVVQRFVQDSYYGLETNNRSIGASAFGVRDWGIAGGDAFRTAVQAADIVMKCQCRGLQPVTDIGLDIAGGNILVGDTFVLIGKDELYHGFLNYKSRGVQNTSVINRLTYMGLIDGNLSRDSELNRLNLNPSKLASDVTKWLEEQICQGKKIVWVGTDQPKLRYYNTDDDYDNDTGHAPFYHIDLFIALIGKVAGQDDCFYYLLGVPSNDYQDLTNLDDELRTNYKNTVNQLREHVCTTAHKMEDEVWLISGMKTKLKAIELPLPLQLSNRAETLEDVAAFCNGLVENKNGQVTYYLPVKKNTDKCSQIKYKDALNQVFKTFEQFENIELKLVNAVYEKMSGLHCVAKVLQRLS